MSHLLVGADPGGGRPGDDHELEAVDATTSTSAPSASACSPAGPHAPPRALHEHLRLAAVVTRTGPRQPTRTALRPWRWTERVGPAWRAAGDHHEPADHDRGGQRHRHAELEPGRVVEEEHPAEHEGQHSAGRGEPHSGREHLGHEQGGASSRNSTPTTSTGSTARPNSASSMKVRPSAPHADARRRELVDQAERADRQQQEGDVGVGEALLDERKNPISWSSRTRRRSRG
jgi:hypothetical protein